MITSKKLLQKFKSIVGITSIWFVMLMLYFNLIYQTIEIISPGLIVMHQQFFESSIIALVLGLLASVIEVFTNTSQIRRLPFFVIVLFKTILFLCALIATVFIINIIDPQSTNTSMNFLERIEDTFSDFAKKEFLWHGMYTIIFAFFINLFLQIHRMMGKGVLRNLFFGRYHTPREQKRIIGFVDLTSSTSIAEKLSPQEYSSFIRDFFYDLDEAFEETKGAVFQFVGDEVVVIWNHEDGILNNNCVKFFFLAEDLIKTKEEYYISRYGLSPKFKAGVHSGSVIVAEVGGSKTDIAYHGDTINTAARIRSMCGELERTLLISAELLGLLNDIDEDFNVESMGVMNLKGKENIIGLFSVTGK